MQSAARKSNQHFPPVVTIGWIAAPKPQGVGRILSVFLVPSFPLRFKTYPWDEPNDLKRRGMDGRRDPEVLIE